MEEKQSLEVVVAVCAESIPGLGSINLYVGGILTKVAPGQFIVKKVDEPLYEQMRSKLEANSICKIINQFKGTEERGIGLCDNKKCTRIPMHLTEGVKFRKVIVELTPEEIKRYSNYVKDIPWWKCNYKSFKE